MRLDTRAGETALLLGCLALAAGIALWLVPAGIPVPRGAGAVTPRSVPLAVAAGIGAVCLVRLATLWLRPAAPDDVPDDAPGTEQEARHPLRLAAIVLLCLLLAPVLIPQLGFHLAGAGLMLAVMALLGERRWPALLGAPVALALAVHGLFEAGFGIRLPRGSLLAALPGF